MNQFMRLASILICLVLGIHSPSSAEDTASISTATNDRIYAILSTVLSDPATHTEFFSDNAYQSVVSQIEAEGFTLSDDFSNQGTLYTYDASMSLLEVEWGPYHFWTIEQKHLFDQLMVSIGQLPYCFNLLPANGDISQEAALELAILEVNDQYGVAQEDLWATEQLIFSYYIADTDSPNGMWRINIQIAQGESFSVHVFNGRVIHCTQDQYISDLEKEYNSLCASKGAFFTWSLYDKMTFAQSLPEKLAQAERSNTLLMSETELRAIADYGFCLPTSDCIDQNAAYELARNAVTD